MSWSVGDPSAMRSLASELRRFAGRLEGTKSKMDKALPRDDFEGPMARRMARDLRKNRSDVAGIADRLDRLASYVSNAAEKVAQEQYRLEVERIRRQAEAEADARRRAEAARRKRQGS